MGKDADVERLHGLHRELRDHFTLKATFLYGHTLSTGKGKEQHDFAALYRVAERIARLPGATPGARNASAKAMGAVEALVGKHLAELSGIDPDGEIKPGDGAWIGHLPMFLRAFRGGPEADATAKKWAAVLEAQGAVVRKELGAFSAALDFGDKPAAFSAGLRALQGGFLTLYAADNQFLGNMNAWLEEGAGA